MNRAAASSLTSDKTGCGLWIAEGSSPEPGEPGAGGGGIDAVATARCLRPACRCLCAVTIAGLLKARSDGEASESWVGVRVNAFGSMVTRCFRAQQAAFGGHTRDVCNSTVSSGKVPRADKCIFQCPSWQARQHPAWGGF